MSDLLVWPHCVYIVAATLLTGYQGWRGWHFQALMRKPTDNRAIFNLSRSLEDCIFYAVCSLAGFAALLLTYRLLRTVPPKDIPSGALAFLASVGVLGVSGQLPYWIQKVGKMPGS